MFERFTEKARRTIFFARYEASGLGSAYIETEHLLLGLLREDRALTNPFLPSIAAVASIRKRIEGHTPPVQSVSTSVDLPISHECKRALAYGAEESERLHHKHIGTEHLLMGLLREKECFAAQLLGEAGVTLDSVRQQALQPEPPAGMGGGPAYVARLDQWLTESEAPGRICAVRQQRIRNRTCQFAIYAADQGIVSETGQDKAPAEELVRLQKRIDWIGAQMEHAVADHEFDKARFYSGEERKERENLRLLREKCHLEEPPPQVPFLCIEIIHHERFSELQQRCDDYLADGVAEVWLLDPKSKRAYTVTKAEGFREFKGTKLQILTPPLEMDLATILD